MADISRMRGKHTATTECKYGLRSSRMILSQEIVARNSPIRANSTSRKGSTTLSCISWGISVNLWKDSRAIAARAKDHQRSLIDTIKDTLTRRGDGWSGWRRSWGTWIRRSHRVQDEKPEVASYVTSRSAGRNVVAVEKLLLAAHSWESAIDRRLAVPSRQKRLMCAESKFAAISEPPAKYIDEVEELNSTLRLPHWDQLGKRAEKIHFYPTILSQNNQGPSRGLQDSKKIQLITKIAL